VDSGGTSWPSCNPFGTAVHRGHLWRFHELDPSKLHRVRRWHKCGWTRHHWGNDPAFIGSIAVVDDSRTTLAERRSFTGVHKDETAASLHWRPFGLVRAIFSSSGDRIRTCDLWVMSYLPGVSSRSHCRKSAGQTGSGIRLIARGRTDLGQFHGVLFPNLIPSDR
jgi:hypothetical protein